jgi:signal transduction histidine kinase
MTRSYSVSTLLSITTGTLVLVLVTVFALSARNAYERVQDTSRVLSNVRISRDIVQVREALRIELGVIDTAIAEPDPANAAALRRLALLQQRSNDALGFVEHEIARSGNSDIPPQLYQKLHVAILNFDRKLYPAVVTAVQMQRAARPRNLTADPKSTSNAILTLVDSQAAILSRRIAAAGPYLSEMMRISDIAWHLRVDAGDNRRVMAGLISNGLPLTTADRERLAKVSGRIEAPWESIEQSMRNIAYPRELTVAIADANRHYFGSYLTVQNQVVMGLNRGKTLKIDGQKWLNISNPALNSLMRVSKAALDMAETRSLLNLNKARNELKFALLLMILSIGLACLASGIVLWRVIRPLKKLTRAIDSKQDRDIDKALALCGRGDEIGQFAQALKTFRNSAREHQRLEGELQRNRATMEAAKAASRIKSEFLANMSHELRTPLNAVIGFSELIMHKTFGPMPERYEEYITLIHDSGNHLLNLVSDILDLAKIEAGRFKPDFRKFDLQECAEQCLPLVRRRAEEKGLQLIADLPDHTVEVEADPRACKQILLNLLSNAVKFSKDQGDVRISIKELGENVTISVQDDGIGIPADVLARVGQAFEQASNNPMLAREGTGLGLALVKALTIAHEGNMTIKSKEGIGTTITIVLPRQRPVCTSQPAQAA